MSLSGIPLGSKKLMTNKPLDESWCEVSHLVLFQLELISYTKQIQVTSFKLLYVPLKKKRGGGTLFGYLCMPQRDFP